MEKALKKMDEFLGTKTVHSTRSLTDFMIHLCKLENRPYFSGAFAHEEFAQKCRNFEIFAESINKTSWGRKQFEQWWNEGKATPDPAIANHKPDHLNSFESLMASLEDENNDELPKIEYALEFYDSRLCKMLKYIPLPMIPPLYTGGVTIEIDDETYRLESTTVSIQTLDNGMTKITHQVRVK
jgi:hypothetical protein